MLVVVPKHPRKVVPIRSATHESDLQAIIAELAFQYWLTQQFGRNGTPEESHRQAVISVMHQNGTRPGGAIAIDSGVFRAGKVADRSGSPPEAA